MDNERPPVTVILERLERLYAKLDLDGLYVDANTVALAITEIESRADLLESYFQEACK